MGTVHPIKLALDYGCGPRSMAYCRARGYRVVGVELAPKPTSKPMAVYDGRNLPFKDNTFDWIYSQQVIEHVQDLDRYFSEARRVLCPGGELLAEFPTRLMPYDRHKRAWFKHWFQVPKEPWFCFRWPWTIRRIAKRYFSVENRTRERLMRTGNRFWPTWLFNQTWVMS